MGKSVCALSKVCLVTKIISVLHQQRLGQLWQCNGSRSQDSEVCASWNWRENVNIFCSKEILSLILTFVTSGWLPERLGWPAWGSRCTAQGRCSQIWAAGSPPWPDQPIRDEYTDSPPITAHLVHPVREVVQRVLQLQHLGDQPRLLLLLVLEIFKCIKNILT